MAGLLVGVLLLAGPGRAETSVGPEDEARCAAALGPLRAVLSSMPALTEAGPDRCVFSDARIGFGGRFAFLAGSVVVTGGPAAAAAGPVSVHRRLELLDVVSSFQSGQPSVDWLARQQQVPVDMVLDLTEDRAAHMLTVNEASIHGEDMGRLALDGTIERVGPDDPASGLPDLSEAGVRSVHVQSDSKRFFVRYVLPALVQSWQGDDPAAEMAGAKLQASDNVRGMLQMTRTTPESILAVLAFLQELPKPRHVLEVSLVATGGPVTADDLDDAGTSMMGLATLLSSLRVTATYDRDAH